MRGRKLPVVLQACLRVHVSSVNQGVDLFHRLALVERVATESRRLERATLKSLVQFSTAKVVTIHPEGWGGAGMCIPKLVTIHPIAVKTFQSRPDPWTDRPSLPSLVPRRLHG